MKTTPRALKHQLLKLMDQTFNKGFYASKALEQCFKENKKLGSRDRRFLAENLYEMVRYLRKFLFYIKQDLASHYSLRILERLLEVCENPCFQIKPNIFSFQESFPDWMYKRVIKELGQKKGEHVLKSLNKKSSVYLRVNTLKTNLQFLKKSLENEGFETEELGAYVLKLKKRKNVFLSENFKMGYFEIQDGASQKVAPFLEPRPKMRVLDACAGSGGKTLHLASLMQNKGRILATDIESRKMKELKIRLKRSGVDIVDIRLARSKVFKRAEKTMDRLLLDVPCSGLGVLRRKPDIKWKLLEKDLQSLNKTQKDILYNYEKVVKVSGKMVYATCSILPSENTQVIREFLKNKPYWSLEEEFFSWPDEYDGFYGARLVRKF